jgi:hypothetical protein
MKLDMAPPADSAYSSIHGRHIRRLLQEAALASNPDYLEMNNGI